MSQLRTLEELEVGDCADCFVLLVAREQSTTRDGKPFFRVTFRDTSRSVQAMVWQDSPWFADCQHAWSPGEFYKVRCQYSESRYGPQLDIDRIRPIEPDDSADGFDPAAFYERSRFDPVTMFDELCELVREHVVDPPTLQQLVLELLEEHAEDVQRLPAASRNHHAFASGFLEHVLSVTRTAVFLAEKYAADYRAMRPPLSVSLVVAGAVLHDIGKLRELDFAPAGSDYTPEGRLIGHILQGRDIVRAKAAELPDFDAETLLRLEHVIVSHQDRPEWGSPVAPHTPEALLVHYADDIDAKFHMMARALTNAPDDEAAFTDRANPLRRSVFRGLGGPATDRDTSRESS